ncbi:MAG: S-adenosylmethionine decarboxylase family protein [Candidatus Binatia bacterium]
MIIGHEWLVDAEGCLAERLRDLQTLRRLCDHIIIDLDLHVIGQGVWQQFPPPGGVTGLFLLSESHLAYHTYPEANIATFNLYCCRPRPAWAWQERLTTLLGAQKVVIRVITRGNK